MDTYTPTPRVNAGQLASGRFVGATVRIVGKFSQVVGGQVQLEASDHGKVTIQSANPQNYSTSEYWEVLGKVLSDGTIRELNATSFGNNFDLGNYDQLVQLMPNYSQVF